MKWVMGLVLMAMMPTELTEQDFTRMRQAMVEDQLVNGPGRTPITDERVLAAMRIVPRHLFVPAAVRAQAYDDTALPIKQGQTISQPYIVALMTELARVERGDRVLEIGTGSGYQAAVLARLTEQVYTIEILKPLAEDAEYRLRKMGIANVLIKTGDGFLGWPARAPFDAILVTAAAPEVPKPLLDQLAEGGRLVIPEGDPMQELVVYTRSAGQTLRERSIPVRFVPMTGMIRDGQ